jgi:hypothetical protein
MKLGSALDQLEDAIEASNSFKKMPRRCMSLGTFGVIKFATLLRRRFKMRQRLFGVLRRRFGVLLLALGDGRF